MPSNIENPIPNVLVIGGSGYVGRLVLPLLLDRFSLRIFDRNPPDWLNRADIGSRPPSYHEGDVTRPDALLAASQGMDILLYMAMGRVGERDIDNIDAAYDVNVKGPHIALDAAVKAGIKKAVYTSSLSVFDGQFDIRSGATDQEEVFPRPSRVYGFTKWLGEEVFSYFHRAHGLPVAILRLFHPVSVEDWHARLRAEKQRAAESSAALLPPPYCATAAPDLARALAAALLLDHRGCEVFHVTGDTSGRGYRHQKAKRILDWEPEERE